MSGTLSVSLTVEDILSDLSILSSTSSFSANGVVSEQNLHPLLSLGSSLYESTDKSSPATAPPASDLAAESFSVENDATKLQRLLQSAQEDRSSLLASIDLFLASSSRNANLETTTSAAKREPTSDAASERIEMLNQRIAAMQARLDGLDAGLRRGKTAVAGTTT